jgi:hypothetical protein
MAEEQKDAMAGDRGDAKAQPSGTKSDKAATAGKDETKVTSDVPEKAVGQINPSSPADTGTTPGTVSDVG